MSKFLHESFGEKSSIYSLKELLEELVKKSRSLKSHRNKVMQMISGTPPTSHFHVLEQYDSLLLTLELNFFLTKYFEMSDREGRKVSVFALNYGLCEKYSVGYGRPTGKREFRLYFVERIFDYTTLLRGYIAKHQEIVCKECNISYDYSSLEALKMYKMKCPNCTNGFCEVRNLADKYLEVLQGVDENLLLPSTELGILRALHSEGKPLYARDIAAELDCSYQLVGKRGAKLADRGLVDRTKDEPGRRTFEITEDAETAYFSDSPDDDLDLA
ncbi:MAG: MarR family transcriptional regulator [Proteobacteria bacterium]|nr:MAG: MarR family transcriptional regulator [Pseudomonadota bacterium]